MRSSLGERLTASFWVIPAAFVGIAVSLALLLPLIDDDIVVALAAGDHDRLEPRARRRRLRLNLRLVGHEGSRQEAQGAHRGRQVAEGRGDRSGRSRG